MTQDTAPKEELIDATIRFAGDSGDGIQVTGGQFTRTTGVAGNDLMTFPDFPAEIRAPQGTLAGVSGFQIHFGSVEMFTPGDEVDVLVVMNPAALKANLSDLKRGGVLIANTDAFDERSLSKVQYDSNPLEDQNLLDNYKVVLAPITTLTRNALEDMGLQRNHMDRCKNFFALGVTYWLFHRQLETTLGWIEQKFKKKPEFVEANQRALKAGYNFADTSELFTARYEVDDAQLEKGTYRNVTGASSLALGLVAGCERAGLSLFYGSYPITPASDILHELSRYKNFGVRTFQAEDEIAAVCAAIGASYGGAMGITASSGPGINLKLEAIGLAVMTELPLVIIDAQRSGPSTGLPTKNEQGDLLQALFGRNSDSPIPVIAPATPGDCFFAAMESIRIALEFMTPVFLLSDLYLTMGSEPWRIPEIADLPEIKHRQIARGTEPNGWMPYKRDPETLARTWAVPGLAGFEHRIGGLEKAEGTGNVSYDPDNHQHMNEVRAKKIENIANYIPEATIEGPDEGKLLIVAWGSTYGAIRVAVSRARARGLSVAHVHLTHLNPFPKNLGELLGKFDRVLVPELNMGQLSMLIRARFLRQVDELHKITGRPFLVSELQDRIEELAS